MYGFSSLKRRDRKSYSSKIKQWPPLCPSPGRTDIKSCSHGPRVTSIYGHILRKKVALEYKTNSRKEFLLE